MQLGELEFVRGPVNKPAPDSVCTALLAQLPGWTIEGVGPAMLCATFNFKTYGGVIAFVNCVAELAEEFDHHPSMTVEYGRVTVRWWTHTAKGVTTNDFLLAARTQKLAN